MKQKPLIGVTPGYEYEQNKLYINNGYLEAINTVNGIAVLLPLTVDFNILDNLLDRCDGVLLTGGPDVDAKIYFENNLVFNGEISPYRDCMEIYLAKKAAHLNKPILGICRGIQIINIAFGGSLYQDINSQIDRKDLIKHSQNAPKWYPTHEILLERNSLVFESFLEEKVDVNSFHHQSIKNTAKGFRTTAKSPDGIIEAIEHDTQKFIIGVQWHPEIMWKNNEKYLKIFEMFVNECAK